MQTVQGITRTRQRKISKGFLARAVQPFSEVQAYREINSIFIYRKQKNGSYIKEPISSGELFSQLQHLASERAARQISIKETM